MGGNWIKQFDIYVAFHIYHASGSYVSYAYIV